MLTRINETMLIKESRSVPLQETRLLSYIHPISIHVVAFSTLQMVVPMASPAVQIFYVQISEILLMFVSIYMAAISHYEII